VAIVKIKKNDIIDAIYEKTGIERADVKLVFEECFAEIKAAICNGRTLEMRGFGTFGVRIRKGRKIVRNPRTGEPVTAKQHGVAVWKPGQEIKREVWNIGALPENNAPLSEKKDTAT
jgi:integration host factor subunit beta